MSQASQILRDLRKGKTVTPLEALKEYGSLRLGARIFELKRKGHHIVKDMVHDRKRRRRYARYRLARGKAA